jgi:hypothetical protein
MKLLSSFSILSKPAAIRALSSKFNASDCHIVTLKDGTVAAWHPQKEYSFQHTQAIDLEAVHKEKKAIQELQAADNYQRRQSSQYKDDGPDNQTLQNIFTVGPLEFKTRPREDRLHETAAPIPKRK